MSTHKSTKSTRSAKLVGGTAAAIPAARTGRVPKPRITRTHVLPSDPKSLKDFAELLKLRSLEDSTQAEYLRNVRRLGSQTNRDPADLAEADLRAYILKLKDESDLSPSSMRTAAAAFEGFYIHHLGHTWTLFSLLRCPDHKTLPEVLTVEEVHRLLSAVKLPRFRVLFGLLYGCGLRLGEALSLQVTDIRDNGRHIHLSADETKGHKARVVPLPSGTRDELRAYWRTHRHSHFIFPSLGMGWRDRPAAAAKLAYATTHMQHGAAQVCMRLARAAAGLPERVVCHTLRHSYATHLLDKGVSIRLISAYMGHSSLDITARYLHLTTVNEKHAREAIEQLKPKLPPLVF
jgi:integrase